MTPGKEGPPTLRECRKALEDAKDLTRGIDAGAGVEIDQHIGSILGRLTYEALTQDEKRRALAEKIANRKFTNSKECSCRPGPCPTHSFVKSTICFHCRNPQEGMNFECDDCTKRRAALERIAEIMLEDGKHGSNGRHAAQMETGESEAPCELCDLLDALTPAPKEKT